MTAYCKAIGDGLIGIWSDFQDKDRVKQLPGARWNRELKCWCVHSVFRSEVLELVDRLNGVYTEPPPQRPTEIPANLAQAYEALFRYAPKGLAESLYKAHVKVLHPDAGGDLKAMQALTAAWAKRK